MVLGLLLARAGVEVTGLEKHEDFLHDFRGDTVHPATLQLLDELGLGERFARLPQTRITDVVLPDGDGGVRRIGDFGALRRWGVRHPYVAVVLRTLAVYLVGVGLRPERAAASARRGVAPEDQVVA
jgi:2-polyprenyl-6-methoxyphenol hydroxylase-like FAD-dependent oxidoreductase